jgi:haloalkane dehalogenase
MTKESMTEQMSYPSHYVEVLGSKMHYIEAGVGRPILFLHGIPTSSYVWRNVIPHLASLGRCIAVDLIGYGQSDKPDITYSVADHIAYVDKFIATLKLEKMILVMHGFGSVIGFDYAMRHQKNCAGLVFYEAFLHSLNGNAGSLPLQEQLIALQDDAGTYDTVLSGLDFIDKVIPQSVMHELTDEVMNHYRKPFVQAENKPILNYLQEISALPDNNKLEKLIVNYSEKLSNSTLPKLMLYSIPGFITTIATAMWAKENLPNLEMVDIGEELHLAQETCPELMGETISVWLQGVEAVLE